MKIILLLVIFGILLFLLLNFYYVFIVRYNEQEEDIKRGTRKKFAYEIVAFGSSYARYAYDFSVTNLRGYNFGIVAQFLYYTDLMVRSFRDTYHSGAYIIITIPDLCFGKVGKGTYNSQRYVRFVKKEILGDEYSYTKYLHQSYFPLFTLNLHSLKRCLEKIVKNVPEKTYSSLEHNELTVQENINQAKRRCKDWCMEFGLRDTKTSNIPESLEVNFEDTTKLLREIIVYCLQEELRPVLVVTPVSEIMNHELSQSFLEKVLYSNIRKANTAGIPVLNYMQDSRFASIDLYANNADFLNARGKRLFSEIVVEDIIKAYSNHGQ